MAEHTTLPGSGAAVPVAELVDLGINPAVAEEAARLTDEDDILDLATGTPVEEILARAALPVHSRQTGLL